MNEHLDVAVRGLCFSCLQEIGLKVLVPLKLTGCHSCTMVVVAASCWFSLIPIEVERLQIAALESINLESNYPLQLFLMA